MSEHVKPTPPPPGGRTFFAGGGGSVAALWLRLARPLVTATPGVPPTFLRSAAPRSEDDEDRQDENPGPCRSPAHHYRSAHSSLQSECILLACGPGFQPAAKRSGKKTRENRAKGRLLDGESERLFCFCFSRSSGFATVLLSEITAPHTLSLAHAHTLGDTHIHTHTFSTHSSELWIYFLHRAPPPPPHLKLGYPTRNQVPQVA